MPNEHAILSASSSHRWLECTPSARLEQEFNEYETVASKEGTAAHALAEHKLKRKLKMRSDRPVSPFNDEDMELYTDDYADYVFEQYTKAKRYDENTQIFIEQKLDFSCYVPDGFGTGDAVIISKGKLQIIDLKYGMGVLVNAENNSQMMLYALGALKKFGKEYDIKKIKMVIFQPRRENVSVWETTVTQLKKWAEKKLRPRAEMAFKGTGNYLPGSHCQFCKAAIKCRARAEENLKIAQQEFKMPPLLSDAEIEAILTKVPELKKWVEAIWDYATEKALKGKQWNGFKVVQGKSVRKYSNEEKVVDACNNAGYKDIYVKKLITITEMEKLMGKKVFNEVLGSLIEKPAGKPTLVEESDKRPAITTAMNEFNVIKEEN